MEGDFDQPANTTLTSPPENSPADAMTAAAPVIRWHGGGAETGLDLLAVEEPLQIRLAGEDVVVTMRTPGHDRELAAGFLFSEGIIAGKAHIESIAHCPDESTGMPSPNIVNVTPTERRLLEPGRWGRNFYSNSGCGLCGKTSIDQIASQAGFAGPTAGGHSPATTFSAHTLYSLSNTLREKQDVFRQTGGVHAAALFNIQGEAVAVREDVGRHNAVDKVIGYALLNGLLPLSSYVLMVSSRGSFEISQKALAAGVQVLAVVSAPSSLAVELARSAGMTLVAFLRDGRFNVYCGQERITMGGGD